MDPFDDDPFASSSHDPLASSIFGTGSSKPPAATAPSADDPFSSFGAATTEFGDDFGPAGDFGELNAGANAPKPSNVQSSPQSSHIAAEFTLPPDDFEAGSEGELDTNAGEDAFGFDDAGATGPAVAVPSGLSSSGAGAVVHAALAPAALPEFGSPAFEAAPPALQLQVVITAGLLPPHTTLDEYVSLRGTGTSSSSPTRAVPAPSISNATTKGSSSSSFLDDFVGGTGTFDEHALTPGKDKERRQDSPASAARHANELAHTRAQAEADAAAVRIQAAARGLLGRQAARAQRVRRQAQAAALAAGEDSPVSSPKAGQDENRDLDFGPSSQPAVQQAHHVEADDFGFGEELEDKPLARQPAPGDDDFGFDAQQTQPSAAADDFGFDDAPAPAAGSAAPQAPADDFGFDDAPATPAKATAAAAPVADDFGFDDGPAMPAPAPAPITSPGVASSSSSSSSSTSAVKTPQAQDQAQVAADDDFGFDGPATPSAAGAVPKGAVAGMDDFDLPAPPAAAAPATAPSAPSAGFDDFDVGPATPKTAAPAPAAPAAGSSLKRAASAGPSAVSVDDFGPGPAPCPPQRVAFEDKGSSFEDFGFGPTSPSRPQAKVVAPVALPAVAASPAPVAAPAPAPAAPSVAGGADSSLLSRPPLATPQAPVLTSASISSLTLSWPAVPGADGYWLDYEARSRVGTDATTAGAGEWTGQGGRAVVSGSSLLPGPTGVISGLMKDSVYVARVTAVRLLPITLPSGTRVEVPQASSPGQVSGPVRTLNPGAEIARLTAENAALSAEVATIPGIQATLASTRQELSTTTANLTSAKAEIVRLTAALNGKIAELNEAHAEEARLQGLVAERDATIAAETSEVLRLGGELEDTRADLATARADIAKLHHEVEDRDAALAAGAEREKAGSASLAAKEAEVTSLKAKLGDVEAHWRADKAARAELALKYDKAAGQLKSVGSDKDGIISKLSDDVATVMEELSRVQKQLHAAQDHVALIQPAADIVMDIRKRQAAWDSEHASIQAGTHPAVGANPIAKMSALRKLGPRPTITL